MLSRLIAQQPVFFAVFYDPNEHCFDVSGSLLLAHDNDLIADLQAILLCPHPFLYYGLLVSIDDAFMGFGI